MGCALGMNCCEMDVKRKDMDKRHGGNTFQRANGGVRNKKTFRMIIESFPFISADAQKKLLTFSLNLSDSEQRSTCCLQAKALTYFALRKSLSVI